MVVNSAKTNGFKMSEQQIIGRKEELKILKELVKSKEAEFLAVYGRRRVGKTHLVREFFSNKGCYFELTGQKDASLKGQLGNFAKIFSEKFFDNIPIERPKNWKDAFALLTGQLEKVPKAKKCVVFLDELPWLASKRSGLIQALDYYWNRYWSGRKNVILIACGSAASWMLDQLINAKGGLYNRLTRIILLKPYSLREAEEFLCSRGIRLNSKQLCELYMAFGGVPYYLKQFSKGMSATQGINKLCFQKDGLLYGEFERLFVSLFDHSDIHVKIIRAVAKKKEGISRVELIKKLKVTTGGTFNQRLSELEAAGFLQAYVSYGKKKKDSFFRVVDEYVLFYLRWIEPIKKTAVTPGKFYWQTKSKTPAAVAWAGYAFEMICLKHVDQIRVALDLVGISCETGSWRHIPKQKSIEQGAQVDLLFDRDDGVITLCEIKYSDKIFVVDKAYAKQLANKIEVFEKHSLTKKKIELVMITFVGMRDTIWSEELIVNDVIFEELY